MVEKLVRLQKNSKYNKQSWQSIKNSMENMINSKY